MFPPGTYQLRSHSKIIFFDFASSFNKIQKHILSRTLSEMSVPHDFIIWLFHCLNNRFLYVKITSSNYTLNMIS